VDVVGHANNSRYVEWICNCFPMGWYEEHAIEWMQVNYDHEVRPGETVNISSGEVNGKDGLWYLTGKLAERDERAFEAAICWKLR
jgi:acyl-ACP thioesterase